MEDSDTTSYRMRFDIEEMSKDWLVSGRKRGDFIAVVGERDIYSGMILIVWGLGSANL